MAKRRAHRPAGSPTVHRGRPPGAAGSSSRGARPGRTRRQRFEDASQVWLLRMRALPAFLIPALMGVALFLGLAVPTRWSGLLLLVIAAFLGWLAALSWPAASTLSRTIRALVVVGLLVLAALKLLGRI